MATTSKVATESEVDSSSSSSKTPDIMDVCPQLVDTIARRLSKRISSLKLVRSPAEEVTPLSRKSSINSKHVHFEDTYSQEIDDLFAVKPTKLMTKASMDVIMKEVQHELEDISNNSMSYDEETDLHSPVTPPSSTEGESLKFTDNSMATLVEPIIVPSLNVEDNDDDEEVDEEATLIASVEPVDVEGNDNADVKNPEDDMEVDVVNNTQEEVEEHGKLRDDDEQLREDSSADGAEELDNDGEEHDDDVEDHDDNAVNANEDNPVDSIAAKIGDVEPIVGAGVFDIADIDSVAGPDVDDADCVPGSSAVYVPMGPPPIQVAFSFDTTGSMSQCIDEVKGQLRVMIERLFSDIPNLEISIIAHGDYCDEEHFYVTKSIDFTNNIAALCEFVNSVEGTGGGDFEECYEHVLHLIRTKLPWSPNARRSVVMIGDAIPHEPDNEYNKEHIDWKEEADELKNELVCLFITHH